MLKESAVGEGLPGFTVMGDSSNAMLSLIHADDSFKAMLWSIRIDLNTPEEPRPVRRPAKQNVAGKQELDAWYFHTPSTIVALHKLPTRVP